MAKPTTMKPSKCQARAEFVKQFKAEVHDKRDTIDKYKDYQWYAITLGWGISKGMTISDAHEFASYIKYNTDLG